MHLHIVHHPPPPNTPESLVFTIPTHKSGAPGSPRKVMALGQPPRSRCHCLSHGQVEAKQRGNTNDHHKTR